MTLPRYLIATDLSRASRRGAAAAAELAPAGQAMLDFVCVVPSVPAGHENPIKGAVRESLDRLAKSYSRAGFETGSHVLASKHPADSLARHALRTGADVLVAAPQGVTNWKKVAMGGVTERLLRRTTMSLLVARKPRAGKPRIVVGVNGSAGSARAVRTAAALAEGMKAKLDIVEVIAAPNMAIHVEEAFVGVTSHEVARERKRLAKRTLEEWVGKLELPETVRTKARVVAGSAARALVDEAKDRGATLLVVAAQSAARKKSAFVGNTARAVAATAPMSVLVVRGRK